MALPPNGPLLPTELVEDVQQLTGHDTAGSTEVHGPKERGHVLPPEPCDSFNPNPPTTSPIHHNICPPLLGNVLPTLTEWPVPGVGRVKERWLEESGGEDHRMVRY